MIFLLSLGISTPANYDPCLEKEKNLCTIELLEECNITMTYKSQKMNIIYLKVNGQLMNIQWTYDSETQFLVRTTPVYKETYQSQLVICSSAQLDKEFLHDKNLELEKIYTYSTWFPISDNIHSYIVDIVSLDAPKQAVRFFIEVPRKSNSLSPIVVVTIYQDKAAFAVFEQTNQSNIEHYYSLIECSKEMTKDQLGLMNWQLSECFNIKNSIQYNHKMKPRKFETFPLDDGQDYQIWIDSENGRSRDPAFKTPVFGRPDKDIGLQFISAFITGKDSGIEKTESIQEDVQEAVQEGVQEDLLPENLTLAVCIGTAVPLLVILVVVILFIARQIRLRGTYQVSCFQICSSKSISTQEKGHETEKEANSSTVTSKLTQVPSDQYCQSSDAILRSPSAFGRTRITEEHCDSCAPLLDSDSFTFKDHQQHVSHIASHNSGLPFPLYDGLFHLQRHDQLQNYTQALNSFQTSRFRIFPQKAWNSMETILEDFKDLYSGSGFLNTESVPKSSCLFSAFVIAPLELTDDNLSVQDLEEEFRMINEHYHKLTKKQQHTNY
ncbi:hypothetical protein Bpfe_025903 [Biomphalaria pfeifferi]|uniref:Uncharacterized protein n=1 Tax=Biomphalaria pfeifferi TaxID=112525 RepID=A0AAD8EYG0_BIOPF|nr:hypothetical protein Bpfe_025903 [Biomphalaria pfeifferi]